MPNNDLRNAQRNKADEFYTQLVDIEQELKHYKAFFRGKIVLCNCDDPYESNFFKYFAMHFNDLGLKKLIATCYAESPIEGTQLSLFDTPEAGSSNQAYRIEIVKVEDNNGDGAIDLADVEHLLLYDKNTLKTLRQGGDFRSEECIELLKEADVVVTNPPFSLFREYVAQLMEYDKKFIIIGNINAITYKEFFPLIMHNKVWIGCSIHSGDRAFYVPDDYPLNAAGCGIDKDGRKYIRVKGVRWYTNIDYSERHEGITAYKRYSADEYPHYDNYDAIEVSKTIDIPYDYDGVMGVPITFLDKYSPEQFEIIGMAKRGAGDPALKTKVYTKEQYKNYSDLNAGPVLIENGVPRNTYPRVLIKKKEGAVL